MTARATALLPVVLAACMALAGCPAAPPRVDFSASPRKGAVPLHVRFSGALDAATPDSGQWRWQFGDGGGATAHPGHVYRERGLYTVSVEVRIDGQRIQRTKPEYIAALGEFDVRCVNTGDYPMTGVYLTGADAADWGRNHIAQPVPPGNTRTLQQSFRQGQHIVSMLFNVNGTPETLSLRGNLHSVGLKESVVEFHAGWSDTADNRITYEWNE